MNEPKEDCRCGAFCIEATESTGSVCKLEKHRHPIAQCMIDAGQSKAGDITADLMAALRECQSALAMIIAPDAGKKTSALHAFAQATAAEAKARSALAKASA